MQKEKYSLVLLTIINRTNISRAGSILFLTFMLPSCAQLYSVKVGERDLTSPGVGFDVKVNELGFDVGQAARIAKAIGKNNSTVRQASNSLSSLWTLISSGPKTGNITFSDRYADTLAQASRAECAPNKTLSVISYRERNHYPVISGEIVRVTGVCK